MSRVIGRDTGSLMAVLLCLLALVHVDAISPHTQALLEHHQAYSVPAVMGNGYIFISVTIGSQTIQSVVDIASNALVVSSNSGVTTNAGSPVPCGCGTASCGTAKKTFGQQSCGCSSNNTCQVTGGYVSGSYTAVAINSAVTIGPFSRAMTVFLSNSALGAASVLGLAPKSGVGPAMFGSNAIGFCLDANGDQGKVVFGNPGACSSSISYVPMFNAGANGVQNGFFVTSAQVCVGSSCATIPAPAFSLPSGAPSQGQPGSGWLAYVDSGDPYFGIPSASYSTVQNLINQVCATDATCKSTFPNPMPRSAGCVRPISSAQLAHWPVFSLTLNTGLTLQIRDYAYPNTAVCPAGSVAFFLIPWTDNTWALDTALLTSYYTVFDSANGRVGFLTKSSGSSCGSC